MRFRLGPTHTLLWAVMSPKETSRPPRLCVDSKEKTRRDWANIIHLLLG